MNVLSHLLVISVCIKRAWVSDLEETTIITEL